ncbi:MAG: twin-arginine translocation signal domain-containing protein [Pirellulales bacterium]|nr:twin-arginine translocation signal domain-containing protein [Pirellulales bacterium]
MCGCHPSVTCVGCHSSLSRRGFLKTVGTATAAGALGPFAAMADQPRTDKVRVAVVFLANSAGREMWPYPDFDCPARHHEILRLLAEGCPQVEFVPVVVTSPAEVPKAADLKDSVDGYLIYTTTLTWNLTGPLVQIGKLGKPTLVADEYLGGSGVFLVGYSGLHRLGIPAAAVSSTRPDDLVAVARRFADLKRPGMTPAVFANECDEAYRRTFPAAGEMKCHDDPVPLRQIGDCVKQLQQSRFLVVGYGRPGEERDFLGVKATYIGFDELKGLYDRIDPAEAAECGRRWSERTEKLVEPTAEWLQKAGAVYLATVALMKKHGTDSVTMNCLGGFGSGQLPAYPCLGFMQILDDGGQGVCEAMPDDSLSMLMARILTGRPGYVSDPALDTSKNQIVYAHCMAMTKVFGPQGESNRFRIRTLHNRDPRGCCPQSFLPEGYMTTSFRTSVGRKQMVIHQAKAVGNLDADRGCRTQLVGEVRGDIGKLFHQWDHFGWHRVTVYGDVKGPLVEFAKALGLEVVEEA